jgi:hypothetical protein
MGKHKGYRRRRYAEMVKRHYLHRAREKSERMDAAWRERRAARRSRNRLLLLALTVLSVLIGVLTIMAAAAG